MMHRWVVHGAHRFILPNAQQGREHLEGRMLFDAPLNAWLTEFLDIVFEASATTTRLSWRLLHRRIERIDPAQLAGSSPPR